MKEVKKEDVVVVKKKKKKKKKMKLKLKLKLKCKQKKCCDDDLLLKSFEVDAV